MPAEPRHHTPRSDRPTRGGAVAVIAQAKGRPLMPWQRRALDVALEVDPDTGRYWYSTVIVTVQRQAGKTKLIGDMADHRCLTTPRGRVWYTAQTGKDASAWMRDEHFESLADATVFGAPRSPSCKYTLSRRAGSEGVGWPKLRSTFRVFPPIRDGLHSKQADVVIEDEAWAFDEEQGSNVRQAARPAMSTRNQAPWPGAQSWKVSTKGDDKSTYFDGYVQLGEASLLVPDTRICIIDYGIGDDVDPEDLDAIAAAHPAYGYTQTMDTFRGALDDFKSDPKLGGVNGFARAYGNRATRSREAVFPAASWTAAGRGRSDIPDRPGLAFDVTPLGDRAAIGAGWRDDALDLWLEVLYAGPTTRELPEMLAALARRFRVAIGYDPASIGTLDVIDALAKHHKGVKAEPLTTAQYGSSCLTVQRAVLAGTVRHSNQPDLNSAVEVATKRPLGDGGFGYGRKKSTGSIAELVAVTIAARQFDTQPKAAGRPRIILPTAS